MQKIFTFFFYTSTRHVVSHLYFLRLRLSCTWGAFGNNLILFGLNRKGNLRSEKENRCKEKKRVEEYKSSTNN